MSLRTPLGRARGLGSAKEGVDHWWGERLSSLALVPLAIWFVASLVALSGADHAAVSAWLGSPVAAGLMILLLIATFYHANLGLQVVIEDYVHHDAMRLIALLTVKGATFAMALTGILAVLILLFKG